MAARTWSILVLVLFLIFVFYDVEATRKSKHLPPVILIPGYGGVHVEGKLNKPRRSFQICSSVTNYWIDLWVNLEILVPLAIDCWIENVKLIYNRSSHTTSNPFGVQTRIPDFGNTTAVEWVSPSHLPMTRYFFDIAETLVSQGYERGVTLRAAPYDFRKAPNELDDYFLNLRLMIEETFANSGRRVVLLSHSMGSSVLLYFLNRQTQEWKDLHVENWISLAGAWGGTAKVLKIFTKGEDLGVVLIDEEKFGGVQRTFPSLPFMLPSREIWGPGDVLLQTETMNVTTDNFKDLFKALNLPDSYNMHLDTRDLLFNISAPGVETHCLYGVGLETHEKLTFGPGKFPREPKFISGDGDGTVSSRGADFCLKWSRNQKQKVHRVPLKSVDHMEILSQEVSLGYITKLLRNTSKKNKMDTEERVKTLERLEKARESMHVNDIIRGLL